MKQNIVRNTGQICWEMIVMVVCSLFGHRMISEDIEEILKQALITLIEKYDVTMFYVGNHGDFDVLARIKLKEMKERYQYIDYAVVLAYLPGAQNEFYKKDYSDTIYPEEMERVPYRYAIPRRNQWMVERADFVLAYINRPAGGAAQAVEMAEKKGKIVWNLYDMGV